MRVEEPVETAKSNVSHVSDTEQRTSSSAGLPESISVLQTGELICEYVVASHQMGKVRGKWDPFLRSIYMQWTGSKKSRK